MRFVSIILLSLLLIIGCESPGESQNEQSYYNGTEVELGKAPFLLNSSLAKKSAGAVVISENSSTGTVFGLQTDARIYLSEGGEVLPEGTWIGNLQEEPVEAFIGSALILTFEEPTEVTLLDAKKVLYLDADGIEQIFSGSGVITTRKISTVKGKANGLGKSTSNNSSTTIVTPVTFSIGGEGTDPG